VVDVQRATDAIDMACLMADGTVVNFGDVPPASPPITDAVALYGLRWGYVVLNGDGTFAGMGPWETIPTEIQDDAVALGVSNVTTNGDAVVVLYNDGSVRTWGNAQYGGDASAVATQLQSGVARVIAGPRSFAALKHDGSAVVWGNAHTADYDANVAPQLAQDIAEVYLGKAAFLAVRTNGTVFTWGDAKCGGYMSAQVEQQLQAGTIHSVHINECAFAALVVPAPPTISPTSAPPTVSPTNAPTTRPPTASPTTAPTVLNPATDPPTTGLPPANRFKRLPWGGLYSGPMSQDGKLTGYGVLKYPNGAEYRGQFYFNMRHGEGEFFPAKGKLCKYEGGFVKGKRSGTGTLYFRNGDRYLGTFLDDKRHGAGTHTFAHGNEKHLRFVHGVAE
jgi:hypothetical protein